MADLAGAGNATNYLVGPKGDAAHSSPQLTLPKSGGAIRGIGEKFAANPVTGTGSMSVPIATSPGRSGFGPQLSLSYDSGPGNGPFGFGWSLSLPSITRKTERGLPQYFDAQESDVFVLSGAEDLVPVLVQDAQCNWARGKLPVRTVGGAAYQTDRYRPRIEGLCSRIERWTNTSDASDLFWRSISKDNIATLYGKTAESRIADPTHPGRIFSWLNSQSHDDKGNVIVYGYQAEDSARIFEDSCRAAPLVLPTVARPTVVRPTVVRPTVVRLQEISQSFTGPYQCLAEAAEGTVVAATSLASNFVDAARLATDSQSLRSTRRGAVSRVREVNVPV